MRCWSAVSVAWAALAAWSLASLCWSAFSCFSAVATLLDAPPVDEMALIDDKETSRDGSTPRSSAGSWNA
jgi:hypothetical protein